MPTTCISVLISAVKCKKLAAVQLAVQLNGYYSKLTHGILFIHVPYMTESPDVLNDLVRNTAPDAIMASHFTYVWISPDVDLSTVDLISLSSVKILEYTIQKKEKLQRQIKCT